MNRLPKLNWRLWQQYLVIGLLAGILAVAFPSWQELFWGIAAASVGWAVVLWMDKA